MIESENQNKKQNKDGKEIRTKPLKWGKITQKRKMRFKKVFLMFFILKRRYMFLVYLSSRYSRRRYVLYAYFNIFHLI